MSRRISRSFSLLAPLAMLGVLISAGCKVADPNPAPAPDHDGVYAAGNVFTSDSGTAIGTPCYWREGEFVELPVLDGAKGGEVREMAVEGGTAYMCGSCVDGDSRHVPCTWKNDQLTELPLWPGEKSGQADDVFVLHGEVYVAGQVTKDAGSSIACCWKNGERVALDIPVPHMGSRAHAVWVTGKNVYVCGSFGEPGYPRDWLCIWENGVFEKINMYGFAFGDLLVTESGSRENVYVSGTSWIFGQYAEPFVCVNGHYARLAELTDEHGSRLLYPSSTKADMRSIYILGQVSPGGRAGFWKNFVPELFLAPEGDEFHASAMAVSAGIIYLGGSFGADLNSPYGGRPCFFKGLSRSDLPFPENRFQRGGVRSLHVRPK